MERKNLISIVVPVFNEAEVIEASHARLAKAMDAVPQVDYEILFVNDGSSDGSAQRLADLAMLDSRVKVLRFSRNFGHQIAITAGIDHAEGDAVVVIDADLQDPPEVIPQFIDKWLEGYDIVYGVREKRHGETAMKLFTASLFYRLIRLFSKIDIPQDVGDFRLMSRRAVDYLKQMTEKDRFVRGLVSWIGFRQIGVPYTREKRFAGTTKYPYRKMIKFAFDGITSFSTAPLSLATWLGFITSIFAFLYMGSVFVQKLLGNTVQGWATIMVALLFLGGVQLICVGILGQYIGRIFNEVKPRPVYIIQETYNMEDSASRPELPARRPAPVTV